MKKKKTFAFLVVLLIPLFIIFSPPVKAIDHEKTVSTLVKKDSHVESNNPNSNYGGSSQLVIGNYNNNWKEAYLFFDFSDKPENWTHAKISIKLMPIYTAGFLTVSLITDLWGENTINWLNKPKHEEIIATLFLAGEDTYEINVDNYIEGRDSISICINLSSNSSPYDKIVISKSREDYIGFLKDNYPILVWTYPRVYELPQATPPISQGEIWSYSSSVSSRYDWRGSAIVFIPNFTSPSDSRYKLSGSVYHDRYDYEYDTINVSLFNPNISSQYNYQLIINSSGSPNRAWYEDSVILNIESEYYFITWYTPRGGGYKLSIYVERFGGGNNPPSIYGYNLWIIIGAISIIITLRLFLKSDIKIKKL